MIRTIKTDLFRHFESYTEILAIPHEMQKILLTLTGFK